MGRGALCHDSNGPGLNVAPKMSGAGKGKFTWTRRQGVDLSLPSSPTVRQVASWCGRLLGHYLVCGLLHPACAYIKRQSTGQSDWDVPVSENVVKLCQDVAERPKM